MNKLNRTAMLAIATLAVAGLPPSSYASATARKLAAMVGKPKQPKVVTDFDREQLAKAQAKRDKKAARNLKIGRAM